MLPQCHPLCTGGHSFQHPYEEYASSSSGVDVLIKEAHFQAILADSEMPEEPVLSWQRRRDMIADIMVPSMRQVGGVI